MSAATHELELLAGMSRVLEAIMEDVEAARRRVWVESYIVRNDRLGEKLARALVRAHDRGADVRLLYDALGSKNTRPEFIESIRRTGVRVEAYRPLRPFWMRLFPRDHARIVLLDDVAYTGGSAWGDEWLPVEEGGKGWHDVCIRMRGACVNDLERIFERRWHERNGDLDQSPASYTCRHEDLTIVADSARGPDPILRAHCEEVRRAERRIWIENSYFFPPREFLDELTRAADRGVDVRILVPGESDLPSCTRAARGEYPKWLGAGLRIAEYRRTVMHSKIAVIDDDWSTVGTFNINPTSVACAHELNVIVRDRAFVGKVAHQLEIDFGMSEPMTVDAVRRWPLPLRLAQVLTARAFRLVERLSEKRLPPLFWSSEAREKGRNEATSLER